MTPRKTTPVALDGAHVPFGDTPEVNIARPGDAPVNRCRAAPWWP